MHLNYYLCDVGLFGLVVGEWLLSANLWHCIIDLSQPYAFKSKHKLQFVCNATSLIFN